MKIVKRKCGLTVATVLACAVALSSACAVAMEKTEMQNPPTDTTRVVPQLSVRGHAELRKPADQLRITIGVVTEDADAQTAMRSNSQRMQRVVAAIERVGLEKNEYQTGRFQIRPAYSRRPPRPEPDWTPQIIGYTVMNTVNVRTQKMDLAAELIQAANEAGANTIDNIVFDLSSPRTHRREAIREATKHAREDAQTLAIAANLKLVRVLSINLDEAQPRPIPMYEDMPMRAAAAPDAPPIEPGDVTVRATVNIVYEIAPLE